MAASMPASLRQLPDLPGSHRPDVKAFLHHRGIVWAGSRQGLYRIGPQVADFLPDWQDQGEIMALGPAADGIWIAHRRAGEWTLSAGDDAGRRRDSLAFAADDLTCLAETCGALWVGGKRNLYRRTATDWAAVLPEPLAGHVDWIREIDGNMFVAVLKCAADGRPRLLRGDGRRWTSVWTGIAGDRLRATNGRRHFCKWTGDQSQPERLAKPILAAAFFDDGTHGTIRASALAVMDGRGREVFRLHDDRLSRGLWLARNGRRIVVAGEQGLHAVDLDSHAWTDLTAAGNGPRRAARIKHVWNAGPERFLLCATHGTFASTDRGATWNRVAGAPDILHSRRLFRAADGSLVLATRDGIFQSADGGRNWHSLDWTGDGTVYDKLSGVSLSGGIRVFGGKSGLCIQAPGAAARSVAALADRRIEDIVAAGPARLLVLCHGGEVFALDTDSGTTRPFAHFPAQDARALAMTPAGLLLLGRKSLFRLGSAGPDPIPLPQPDREYSFSVGGNHCAALAGSGAWIAALDDWCWQPVAGWPAGLDKPSGALSDDGRTLIFTDNHRLWKLDIAPAAAYIEQTRS